MFERLSLLTHLGMLVGAEDTLGSVCRCTRELRSNEQNNSSYYWPLFKRLNMMLLSWFLQQTMVTYTVYCRLLKSSIVGGSFHLNPTLGFFNLKTEMTENVLLTSTLGTQIAEPVDRKRRIEHKATKFLF